MRTLAVLALAGVLLAAAGGCVVTSLHPFYTPDQRVALPQIVGRWSAPDSSETWVFERADSLSMRAHLYESQDSAAFDAVAVKLAGELYLDLQPRLPEHGGDFWKAHLLAGHAILRLPVPGDSLVFTTLDADSTRAWLRTHPRDLGHELLENDTVVLTASTARLQAFVIRARGRHLFGSPATYARVADR